MNFTTTQHDSVTVVQITDKLVMSNAEAMRESLAALVDQGNRRIVIDLRLVGFVDSSGLAVLIALFKRLSREQGQLVLLHPQNNVRALIELTRLHQLFDIYEDDNAAIRDLQAA